MDENGRKKVVEIKKKIARGDYQVDPRAVADAILLRLQALAEARAERLRSTQRSART